MWKLDHNEGWKPKNWCFQIVVLEKTLESPLNSKEISPEYSLEGLMLKLKLQYFGHLTRRADSLEKILMLERLKAKGEEGSRGWDGWMASPIQRTWTLANSRRWWGTGRPGMLQFLRSQGVQHNWAIEQQQRHRLQTSPAQLLAETRQIVGNKISRGWRGVGTNH